jgi:hypothetical protein
VAIYCDGECGPSFGYYCIALDDDCGPRFLSSNSDLDHTYTNDTGLEGKFVLTGSWQFQVKEIEVFEITD